MERVLHPMRFRNKQRDLTTGRAFAPIHAQLVKAGRQQSAPVGTWLGLPTE